ncbi:uncharacterized protein EI90DRAFT_3151946 [Cantharellus anzutake]|uniref:uncharacterized protein n=1 Tax=Cantharellus anzutake TaxID=1750568 RepID=UPI001908DB1D|nr:uncharacterized protein EI90DRAFT_3151946 [Cantharellus anzutake]KAF8338161.1 hypothetical protein EI90DRAFT_3151946 [Cantharellus anzutake]
MCAFKHDANIIPANFVKHFDPKSHPSYRTKPCYAWLYGICQKGEECTFKHERPTTPSEVPTVASTSNPGDPSQLPPNYRTSDCKWFNSPGGCWYGSTCKFKHSTPSETASTKEDSKHPFYRTRPCTFFLRGACPKGDNCNYLHDDSVKNCKGASMIGSSVLVTSPKTEKLNLTSAVTSPESVGTSSTPGSGLTQEFSPYHSRTSSSFSSTETAVELVTEDDARQLKFLDDETNVDEDDVIVYIPPCGSPLS